MTLVLVSVDSIVDIFRVLEIMSNHGGMKSLGLCATMKEQLWIASAMLQGLRTVSSRIVARPVVVVSFMQLMPR